MIAYYVPGILLGTQGKMIDIRYFFPTQIRLSKLSSAVHSDGSMLSPVVSDSWSPHGPGHGGAGVLLLYEKRPQYTLHLQLTNHTTFFHFFPCPSPFLLLQLKQVNISESYDEKKLN